MQEPDYADNMWENSNMNCLFHATNCPARAGVLLVLPPRRSGMFRQRVHNFISARSASWTIQFQASLIDTLVCTILVTSYKAHRRYYGYIRYIKWLYLLTYLLTYLHSILVFIGSYTRFIFDVCLYMCLGLFVCLPPVCASCTSLVTKKNIITYSSRMRNR